MSFSYKIVYVYTYKSAELFFMALQRSFTDHHYFRRNHNIYFAKEVLLSTLSVYASSNDISLVAF